MTKERTFRAACAAAILFALATPHVGAVENPLHVNLHGTVSHLEEASATIFGAGANVLVDVTRYRAVGDGTAVSLNAGSCARPGTIVFRLSPFEKYGSLTQLPHPVGYIAAHARSMVIHQTDRASSPAFACGNLVP